MIKITTTNTTTSTNTEGNATFQQTLSDCGKYTVQAQFEGNTLYGASNSNTQTFKVCDNSTVSKISPTLVMECGASNNIIYCGVNTEYTATLTNNGSPISGVTVYFVYLNADNNPVPMGNASTGSDGKAKINFTSSDKTDGSTWRMYAYINETDNYTSKTSENITVTNKRIPTSLSLSVSPSSGTGATTSELSATLKDTIRNTVITGKTIQFLKGGASLGTANTDSTGVAKCSTGSISSTTSFSASYPKPDNECYDGQTSNSATLTITSSSGGTSGGTTTVKDTSISITSFTSSVPIGNDLSVSGKLTDSGGNAIGNATVTMNITSTGTANINVTGVTGTDGTFTLTRKVEAVGEWYVVVKYAGSSGKYNSTESDSKTVTTYNGKATSISNLASNGSSLSYGSVIDPILKDYNGNPISSKSVTISLSWSSSFPSSSTVSYLGSTGSNGKFYRENISYSGVKLELASSGTLYVKVEFGGDSSYDSCTVTRYYSYTGGSG